MKYKVRTTKKDANKLLTAAVRKVKNLICGKTVEAVPLCALQACFGWQKKNCERIKRVLSSMKVWAYAKGACLYLDVPLGRKVIDFVFANKA